MFKVIVAGGRDFDDYPMMVQYLDFVFSETKEDKEALNLARISANNLIMDLNECQKQLREYSLLLDSVMRQTDITWPPKCSTLE